MPLPVPSTIMSPVQNRINSYYNQLQVMVNRMQALFNYGDNMLYNNPDGYPASTVAQALSTTGAAVLQWQALLGQNLTQIGGQQPLSNSVNYSLQVNPDGTILIVNTNPGPLSTLGNPIMPA